MNTNAIKDVFLGAKAKDFLLYAQTHKVAHIQAYMEGDQVTVSFGSNGQDQSILQIIQPMMAQITSAMDTRQTMMFFAALTHDVIAMKALMEETDVMKAKILAKMNGDGLLKN